MKSTTLIRHALGSLLVCCLATVATGQPAQDFTSLPPQLADTEDQVRSARVDILQAIRIAQESVEGVVRSAVLLVGDDDAAYEVIAYSGGKGYRITINAESGEVTETVQFGRFPGDFSETPLIDTEEGLKYQIIREGEGEAQADDNATVKIDFEVFLVNGMMLWSTYEAGETAEMPLQSMFEGMALGIAGMREGEKRKLVIPHNLAFGEQGGQNIPPMATIIMDVELLQVVNYERVPEQLPGEPVEGEPVTTESGLMYYEIEVGEGDMPESDHTRVKVHYTGYLVTGDKFDSSVDRGAPATFALDGVIRGWTEGVGTMRVGGKRKLIIPFDLGYGEFGNPPRIPARATLIFDVELLEIVEDGTPRGNRWHDHEHDEDRDHDHDHDHRH